MASKGESNKNKVILFDDDSDNQSDGEENFNQALEKKQFQGKKGQMLMELQHSYRDDKRFQLDKKFKGDIDVKKVSKNVKNMSTVFDKPKDMTYHTADDEAQVKEEISTEKNKNLSILSQVISNTEFLTHNKKYTGNNAKNILIKRFDPKLNLGRQLEITENKSDKDAKINLEAQKNVIKLEKGLDKFYTPSQPEQNFATQSKRSKELEINKIFNKLNDKLETKIEIKYDSLKQIFNVPQSTGFGLFGETIENKPNMFENRIKKKKESDLINDDEHNLMKNEDISGNDNSSDLKNQNLEIDDKKLLKAKRKKEKRKLKEKEKKEKAKIEDKERDVKIEEKLKKNLLKEFDEKKVDDYVRYVNLVRNKKMKQS